MPARKTGRQTTCLQSSPIPTVPKDTILHHSSTPVPHCLVSTPNSGRHHLLKCSHTSWKKRWQTQVDIHCWTRGHHKLTELQTGHQFKDVPHSLSVSPLSLIPSPSSSPCPSSQPPTQMHTPYWTRGHASHQKFNPPTRIDHTNQKTREQTENKKQTPPNKNKLRSCHLDL